MNSEIIELKIKYETAIYEVQAKETFKFKINQYSTDLANILSRNKVTSAAFITAYNPQGKVRTSKENIRFQKELLNKLKFRNLQFFEGSGYDADGAWDSEISALILGIDYEAAKSLGSQFNQLAIVWIDNLCIPRLVMLDDVSKKKTTD